MTVKDVSNALGKTVIVNCPRYFDEPVRMTFYGYCLRWIDGKKVQQAECRDKAGTICTFRLDQVEVIQ
jgi:hypothetical protein